MVFTPLNITSAGATVDTAIGFGQYSNIEVKSSGLVVLAGNIVFATTTTAGQSAFYRIRWNGEFTLGSFSTTIEGFVINQSDVNQTGTFECYFDGSVWTVQYFADGLEQPQVYYGVQAVTVPTSGTLTLTAGVSKYYQRLSGAPTTLVAAYNVTANTAGVKDGTQFFIEIAGTVTTGVNAFTVFGQTILAADALNGGAMVIATFDATASVWRSVYIQKALAITQFPSVAALTVIANGLNSTAVPTAIPADANGKIFMRRAGALRFDWLEADNFSGSTQLWAPRLFTGTIASGAILTSNATPVVILSQVTAGGLPILITMLFGMSSGGSAYASHTNIGIRYTGASDDIASFDGALAITGTDYYSHQLVLEPPAAGAVSWGSDIELYTKSGNPTAGTRSILYALYVTTIPAP